MPNPTQHRDDEIEVLAVDPDIEVDLGDEEEDELAVATQPEDDLDDVDNDEAVAR